MIFNVKSPGGLLVFKKQSYFSLSASGIVGSISGPSLDQPYFSPRVTLNFTDIPEKCLIK